MTLDKTVFVEIQKTEEWKTANQYLQAKREQAIAQMGEKWIMHPVHHIKKKETK